MLLLMQLKTTMHKVFTILFNFMLPTNLLRTLSMPTSKSLINTLNSTWPRTDPYVTLLETSCHPDTHQFTITLCLKILRQFSIHLIVVLSTLHFYNLLMRRSYRTIKSFAEIQIHSSTLASTFPLFTQVVTLSK